MKEFHFTKTYFNSTLFEDAQSRVRVVVDEKPSINLTEEEYSLRVSTRYEDMQTVHRNYAIEHYVPPSTHTFPHLQFKFHTEEIGQFRIRIDVQSDEEYKKAILGFIYKIRNVLMDLERLSKGITSKILVLHLVNTLSKEGDFLSQKVFEGVQKYSIEFDEKRGTGHKIERLKVNPLLLDFIGKKNLDLIEEEWRK